MPDSVQPDMGQGDSGTPGVFDSYLQSVPEDGREAVSAYLKDAEKNVNSRLSEAAQLKETWGPYDEHLASYREQYSPEALAQILAWHQQVTADDNTYQQWLSEAAKQAGLLEGEALPEDQGELSREEIASLIEQQANERISPIQERLDAYETERMVDQEEQNIRSELDHLETESKLKLTPEQRATVLDLGMSHEGDGSWVQSGFERFRAITNEGQRLFVANAQQQPASPMATGGVPASKPPTTFKEAGEMARERLRAAQ
jgi:hypothetical protein